MSAKKLPMYVNDAPVFPCVCDLCEHTIFSRDDDIDSHGYGNCVPLTPEMEKEIEEFAKTIKGEN